MTFAERLRHLRLRRAALHAQIDAFGAFETWEETCVPSYLHPNFAAALVSWWRLFDAVDLAARHTSWGPVLDFGASVGELAHVLPAATPYWAVEQEQAAADVLRSNLPDAHLTTLENAPDGEFAVVFALDSLEHNKDYAALLRALAPKLAPDGVLLLSGPTESTLYKLGRRIAGFNSHYHETNILAIEAEAATVYRLLERCSLPFGAPLFQLTAWSA